MRKSNLKVILGTLFLGAVATPVCASVPGDGQYVLDAIYSVGSDAFENSVTTAESGAGSVSCSTNDAFQANGTGSIELDVSRSDWSNTTYFWHWETATNAPPADYLVRLTGEYTGVLHSEGAVTTNGVYTDSFGNTRQPGSSPVASPVQGLTTLQTGNSYISHQLNLTLNTQVYAKAHQASVSVGLDHSASGELSVLY